MTVTIPLVVLVAALAFVAWRFMGLRIWQLILCLLLGFLLAATSAAPETRLSQVGPKWRSCFTAKHNPAQHSIEPRNTPVTRKVMLA